MIEIKNIDGEVIHTVDADTWVGIKLIDANLYRADLSDSNLRKADLRHADLRHANLRGANLIGANLSCSNLHESNLESADLFAQFQREFKLLFDNSYDNSAILVLIL